MTKKTQSDKKSKNNTKQKPPPCRTWVPANRHAERICGKPSYRTQLPQTVMQNAFVVNRHAEQVASKPSHRTHLPQTVTLNMDAGKPPRRPHLPQTVTQNAVAEYRHAELDSASINSPPTDSHPPRRF